MHRTMELFVHATERQRSAGSTGAVAKLSGSVPVRLPRNVTPSWSRANLARGWRRPITAGGTNDPCQLSTQGVRNSSLSGWATKLSNGLNLSPPTGG